ncbi:MAG: winged helix-turn-helix transcriptional regulator [Thermogutta sp.]
MLRNCPGLSAKVLNQRFRELVRFGIITRVVHGDTPPVQVEYRLTGFGEGFVSVLDSVWQLQEALEQGSFPEIKGTDEGVPGAIPTSR